jgi:putative ABC transport system permease protein
VVRNTVGHSLRLALAGVVIGLAAAMLVGRLIAGLLFGVTPTDPLTLAATSVVVLTTALVASVVPSRRASRVDPQEALRAD